MKVYELIYRLQNLDKNTRIKVLGQGLDEGMQINLTEIVQINSEEVVLR